MNDPTPTSILSVQPSLCCYLDLLGFSDRVRGCETEEASNALLRSFAACLAQATARLKGHRTEWNPWEIQVLSDSILLVLPIRLTWPAMLESELAQLIDGIGYVQYVLALDGFPSRGGLTRGEAVLKGDVCFGKAIVEAVWLEKNNAKWPRLVLGPDLVKLIRHHLTFYFNNDAGTRGALTGVLIDETDGQMFVNYLQHANWDDDETDVEDLERHAAMIRTGLAGPSHSVEKYVNAGRYHNFFIEHFCRASEEAMLDWSRIRAAKIEDNDCSPSRVRFLNGTDAHRITLP